MESRASIEQAKGMLMIAYGFDQDRAFGTLVRWSSVYNIKLRTVAEVMVALARRDDAMGLNAHSIEPMVTESLRSLAEYHGVNRTDT
jgi:hypothetical protein